MRARDWLGFPQTLYLTHPIYVRIFLSSDPRVSATLLLRAGRFQESLNMRLFSVISCYLVDRFLFWFRLELQRPGLTNWIGTTLGGDSSNEMNLMYTVPVSR